MYRKLNFVLLMILLIASASQAQKFQFALVGAYQFGATVDETEQAGGVFDYGDALGISGSSSFGVVFDMRLLQKMKLEISWDRQPTQLNYHESFEAETDQRPVSKLSDLNVDYYLVGLIYDWSQTSLRPFIGGSVGMVRMIPKEDYRTESRFVFAPIVGVQISASSFFAFRAHARFMVGNVPAGELFSSTADESFRYQHHKDTFMIQYQMGLGMVLTF